MHKRSRLLLGLAVPAMLAGSVVLASQAQAVTPGCASDGFCGTQKNFHDGLVFDVYHGVAASNNKVITFSDSVTDKATDYINYHPSSGPAANVPSVKAFEFAPGGDPSGFCLSDPGPGYGTVDRIVLRPCNNSRFQTFKPFQDSVHTDYYSWRNMASNQFITDNGLRGQLTTVKDGHVGDPGNNQPTGDVSQLWIFTQS
jgi:hypothetical protein